MHLLVTLLIAVSSLLHGECIAGPFGRVFAEVEPESPQPKQETSAKPIRIELMSSELDNAVEYPVTLHTTTGCVPCEQMKRSLNSDPRLNVTEALNVIPQGVPAVGFPFVTFHDSNGDLRYNLTARTAEQVVGIIERANSHLSPVGDTSVTATPQRARRGRSTDDTRQAAVGGTIHGRARIVSAIDFIRSRVGEGVTMRFEWDRTGAQSLPLLRGGNWTPLAIYGKSGEFRMSAVGAVNLPVSDVSLGYRIVDGKLRLRGETEIDASVLDWSKSPATASSDKAVGVDPMTVLTVISVLNGIWQALHPTADLTLGGNVACEAVLNDGVLSVKFSQAPSVRIVAWFAFNLGVESIDVSADRVRVGFSGSRWIKERTFEVTQ